MENYVTVMTVLAQVEQENGALEYHKTCHDKKNCFQGELEVTGSEWIHLIIIYDCTIMIHNTCYGTD